MKSAFVVISFLLFACTSAIPTSRTYYEPHTAANGMPCNDNDYKPHVTIEGPQQQHQPYKSQQEFQKKEQEPAYHQPVQNEWEHNPQGQKTSPSQPWNEPQPQWAPAPAPAPQPQPWQPQHWNEPTHQAPAAQPQQWAQPQQAQWAPSPTPSSSPIPEVIPGSSVQLSNTNASAIGDNSLSVAAEEDQAAAAGNAVDGNSIFLMSKPGQSAGGVGPLELLTGGLASPSL